MSFRRYALLDVFVELLKEFSILSLPRDQSVCAPAVYNCRRSGGTRELCIFGEDQEPVLPKERAIGNELFALSSDVRIGLRGWALLQYSGRAVEDDEAVRGSMASRLGSLYAAEEHTPPAGLSQQVER